MEAGRCEINPDCKYAPDCFEDTHHIYWPATNYKSGWAKRFRRLEINRIELCREVHDEVHEHDPPEVPSISVMKLVIDRVNRGDV